ncbi:probable rRNA-processing protein EBP2 [Leptonychotes weddellii]|uniref:Probable rRNA-processing protein EBP2 n=1 Tax=Leptonychotes weddellii TaxID=9713 RepID=A0A7F8Q6F9_LEPWE|nr:probable rRNA-processing protein EBP2 [Leptonychotes weddellii]
MDTPPLSGSDSDSDDSLVTDRELQDAFSRGLLKPGLNVVLEGPKKAVNDVSGLKQCLAEFKRDLEWVERLDVTLSPVPEVSGPQSTPQNKDQKTVDPEDDFQREMSFYRQAQAAVLAVLPRLHQLRVPTKRPSDYFAEMAKSDQQMQKVRNKGFLWKAKALHSSVIPYHSAGLLGSIKRQELMELMELMALTD